MNKCRECIFWKRTSKMWGECSEALQGTWFMNHTKHGNYMAKHTNSRYHGQKACKTRFISRKENNMASKIFCPIMTIGFGPPETGKRDLRLCMKDCAWYNVQNEDCILNVMADSLEYILSAVDKPTGGYYDSYGNSEDLWDDPCDISAKT